MPQEAVAKFRSLVEASPELKSQVREAFQQSTQGAASGVDPWQELGRQHGLELTGSELEAALQDGELTEFELELVSGGGSPEAKGHV